MLLSHKESCPSFAVSACSSFRLHVHFNRVLLSHRVYKPHNRFVSAWNIQRLRCCRVQQLQCWEIRTDGCA